MSLSLYMKGDYEEFHALRRRENKANSKPNKAKKLDSRLRGNDSGVPKYSKRGRDREMAAGQMKAGQGRQSEALTGRVVSSIVRIRSKSGQKRT